MILTTRTGVPRVLQASEMEIIWVMRVGIGVVGILSTAMALLIPSIYGLWSMCSDLVYVILFPQLLMVVHFKDYCNTYGSLAAYIIAFVVRISGGEKEMGLPALIHYPGYDAESNTQMFPFRTMAMLMSLVTLVGVSYATQTLFLSGRLAPGYDVFRCVVNIPEDVERVGPDPAEPGEQMSVLATGHGRLYGTKDESTNGGRVNPALEPDYDAEPSYNNKPRQQQQHYDQYQASDINIFAPPQAASAVSGPTQQRQSSTAF